MENKTRLFIIILVTAVFSGSLVFFIFSNNNTSSPDKTIPVQTAADQPSSIKGSVEPENEILLLSPTRTTVKQAFKTPGSWVEEGELILELDSKSVKEDIERNRSQLASKRVSLEKIELNSKSIELDLAYNEEVKKLRITSLKTTLADQQRMLEAGGITPERINKTKQEIALAEKDLETLTQKNLIRVKQLAADAKSMQLQIEAQEKTLAEKRELLNELGIKAPSSGTILEMATTKGLRVDAGNVLVRMSDLSTFKVVASVSSSMGKNIQTGNQVVVTVNNKDFKGEVGLITTINETNTVLFDVHLKDIDHSDLTLNQDVEIQLTDK
jgi:HlyD family secretion protein